MHMHEYQQQLILMQLLKSLANNTSSTKENYTCRPSASKKIQTSHTNQPIINQYPNNQSHIPNHHNHIANHQNNITTNQSSNAIAFTDKQQICIQNIAYLEAELRRSHIENAGLREENYKLSLTLKQYVRHVSSITQENQNKCLLILKEEVHFRKEEDSHMKDMLQNYQDINRKLRYKVTTLEQEIETLQELYQKQQEQRKQYNELTNTPTVITTTNAKIPTSHNQSFESESQRRSFNSQGKRTQKSENWNENHKENHPITPKSRVNIDMKSMFDNQNQLNIKKKIYI